MTRSSVFNDDEAPSLRNFNESLSSPVKRRPGQDYHQDEDSCPEYQEEDDELEWEEEEGESRSPVNRFNENPRSPPEITDKSIYVLLSDPDVLDCCICFEPLTIPVFQCGNGHIACSSCCNGFRNKCPSCSWPGGYTRCRAIEKVLESVKIPCKHKRYGCEQTLAYSNKKDHESNCPYIPCSCPLSHCGFVSSDKQLYSHFNSEHSYTAMGFRYGVGFRATLDAAKGFLVLQELSKGALFVLSCSVETLGHAIWLTCISSQTSTVLHYDVSAKNGDNFLKLQSAVKFTRDMGENPPPTGLLLVPFGFFGMASCRNLSFDLCVSKYGCKVI